MSVANDEFWDELLKRIERGVVLPVIGYGATTFGEDDELLAPWLAKKLALNLGDSADELGNEPSINEAVCCHLANGGRHEDVADELVDLLANSSLDPGPTLRRLASIEDFKLFISTTIDTLMAKAIDDVRFSKAKRTRRIAYAPNLAEDIPERMRKLNGATVYQIFGRAASHETFVSWEEDVLEFVCALNKHLVKGVLDNLMFDLNDPKTQILAIGLSFSDWLVRFFLRVARQDRLGKAGVNYLADGPRTQISKSLVMYFDSLGDRIQIIPHSPREFVMELQNRWQERHPVSDVLAKPAKAGTEPPRNMPRGAVFISYAHEDIEAAKSLKAGLEFYGFDVWYDRERLNMGMDFNKELKNEVMKCSRFFSVISRQTESKKEAYFHKERFWAAQRAESIPALEEFYFPVIIDGDLDPGSIRNEPEIFKGLQITTLLDGTVSRKFGQRLVHLQSRTDQTSERRSGNAS